MGKFEHSKAIKFLKIMGVILGFGAALAFSVLLLREPSLETGNAKGLLLLIAAGLFLGCTTAAYLPYNRRAFLTLDDGGLTARFGLHKRISCTYGEIDCCVAEKRTLTLTLHGSKKIYCIKNLQNSRELGRKINSKMQMLAACHAVDDALLEKNLPKKKIKRAVLRWVSLLLFFAALGAALMMRGLFETISNDMTNSQWLSLIAYAAIIVTVVVTGDFWSRKYKIMEERVAQDERMLRRRLMEQAPLPPGNYEGVYADPNFYSRTVLYETEEGRYEAVMQDVTADGKLSAPLSPEPLDPEEMDAFFSFHVPLNRC